VTTTERTFERSGGLWKKILGGIGGAFLGSITGGLGTAAAGALTGLVKRDGGEDTTNSSMNYSKPMPSFSLSPTVESMRPSFTAKPY
jgi:hypothetical protein